MKVRVFAVYDEKAKAFGQLGCCLHDGQAMRDFTDQICSPQSHLSKHPEDYKLYCLGEYDDNSGVLVSFPQPEFLVAGSSCVNK